MQMQQDKPIQVLGDPFTDWSPPPAPGLPQIHLYCTPDTHLHHINTAARRAPLPHRPAFFFTPSNSALKMQFQLHHLCAPIAVTH